MKKVRIMLATMIVFGSVGGALALKAKKFGGDTYCTSTGVCIICPTLVKNVSFIAGGNICYRKVPVGTQNCAAVTCTSVGLSIQ